MGLEAQTSATYRMLLLSSTTDMITADSAFAHTPASLVQLAVQPTLLNIHCFWYPTWLDLAILIAGSSFAAT